MEGCVDRCDKDGGYGNRDDAAHQSGNRHALCSAAKTACPSYAYGTEDDCQWAEHKSEKVEVWDEGENETHYSDDACRCAQAIAGTRLDVDGLRCVIG